MASQELILIKNLLLARTGINLEKYIDAEANSWREIPKGFRFIADTKKTRDFEIVLLANPKIAFWPWFKSQRKREYREVSTGDSLHIILRAGNPYEPWKKKAVPWHWEVHLDTISVCRYSVKTTYGRRCGDVDPYHAVKHLLKDYVKWI